MSTNSIYNKPVPRLKEFVEAKLFLWENGSFSTIGKMGPYETDLFVKELYENGARKILVSDIRRDHANELYIEAFPFMSSSILDCICSNLNCDRLTIENNIFKLFWYD